MALNRNRDMVVSLHILAAPHDVLRRILGVSVVPALPGFHEHESTCLFASFSTALQLRTLNALQPGIR